MGFFCKLLSTLVCDFFICESCGIIDRDHERMRRGHPCSSWFAESTCLLAFDSNISLLIDLAQEAFHSRAPTWSPKEYRPQGRDVGTMLIICSLREALLTNFLVENLLAKKVDRRLIERMLDDNRLTSQKLDRLFPSIVGLKWKQAIDSLSKKHAKDYTVVSSLMEEAAKERNKFLHEGSPWRINRDLSKRCIDSLFEWMSLFANLHNEYTQPFWSVRAASSSSTG